MLEAERLSNAVFDRVRKARRFPGGFELTLAWDDEVAGVIDDYLALARKLTPDVERRLVSRGANEATMDVRGPEGYLQSFEHSLAKRGIEVESV